MKYLFIVNPVAGRGTGIKKWAEINIAAKQLGLDFEVVFTSEPGGGVFLAQEGVKKGYDVLVSVGGDGTINEILRGIIEEDALSRVKMGIIPAGTGNDLVRSLNIPFDIYSGVEVLKNANVQALDLGKVNGDYFLNVVGIGFDGAVADEINRDVRWLKGKFAYLFAVLKTLITYKSPHMTIKIDDQVLQGKIFLVAIANGKYYGGGMMIAPDADLTDGEFDICVVKDVSKLEVIRVLPSIYKGNHVKNPFVKIYRGKKVFAESEERVLIQADGELKGTTPMGFEVEPKVLSVLVP